MPSSSPKRAASVTLGAVAGAEHVAVTVADTGIGMDPQDVEIAFQPFGQVDNRLERRYEGTGLGLPLTKALVDLHRAASRSTAPAAAARASRCHPRAISEELPEAV